MGWPIGRRRRMVSASDAVVEAKIVIELRRWMRNQKR
jgi:hypothetical protein